MKVLVALAVLGLCSALPHQAYNAFHGHSYGAPHGGYHQPKYTGPLASSVPAGVGGKVIPVADTYEVSAARDAFFQAYQKQLAAVGRYASPGYHHVAPVHHSHAVTHGASYGSPVHHGHAVSHGVYGAHSHSSGYGYAAPVVSNGHVQDTPAVAAAKAQFFQLYNKQAAAAAAAPDDYTSHHGHYKGHHY